jgi:phosphatidate phosphatase APP1
VAGCADVRYLCVMQDTVWNRLAVRVAMTIEDVLQLLVLAVLRLRGRHHPMIVPFIGHGTPQRIRVPARVLLGRALVEAPPVAVPDAPAPTARSRRAILLAGLGRFVTVEVSRARVRATVAGLTTEARTDREGYLDVAIDLPADAPLAPGWHEVELALQDGTTATARVMVVDPTADIGLVSDVDDTILETGISRGLAMVRATLMTETRDRTPLPGAATLYQAMTGGKRPVFYVSTSPWNLHEMLLEFVDMRGFPLGPLQLTDWGPSRSGVFRIGATEHKTGLVRRILAEHPQLRLVLVGDSGQLDPEIYAAMAREHPDRIAAVYIRRTAHDAAVRIAQVDKLAAEITAAGVPMLAANDSVEIAAHAVGLGLLDGSALTEVREGVRAAARERLLLLKR